MLTRRDIPPGSLVRFPEAVRREYPLSAGTRRHNVGVLIAFDHLGRGNPDKGDPLVLWAGEQKPARMAGSALEIVS